MIKAKHRLKTNWRHVEGVQKVLKVLKILKNHRRCENFGCGAGHWGCDPSNLALRGRSPRSPRSLGLRSEHDTKIYESVTNTLRKRWILWILWILHNSPTVLALLFHSFSTPFLSFLDSQVPGSNCTYVGKSGRILRWTARWGILQRQHSKTKHCLRASRDLTVPKDDWYGICFEYGLNEFLNSSISFCFDLCFALWNMVTMVTWLCVTGKERDSSSTSSSRSRSRGPMS